MSDSDSTTPAPVGKPARPDKPSPDFPLFPHATGRWAKKIDGKLQYFGRWEDPEGALRQYQAFLNGEAPEPPRRPARPVVGRPAKPRPDFPLFPHASGQWAKKIRGQLHYFGVWDDPDAALKKYDQEKDDLHAGRKPRPDTGAATVEDVINDFLNHKRALRDSGELSPLTWGDYQAACVEIAGAFGKKRLLADVGPDDFGRLREKLSRKWGHHRLSKTIQFIRCVFKYAFDADLIERPVRFGPGFKRPSKKVMRLHRAKQGAKLFTADEVRRLIDVGGVQVRAMILLGINCGFGNSDCGNLPQSAVDLERGIIDYPRPKTGIPRRCILWPETVAAIREALAGRHAAKKEEYAGLVFLTRCGDSWHTNTTDGPLGRKFSKLLRRLGINGRKGLGFYTLRHTFRTVADEAKDQPAADFIMGHEIPHMSSVYRETISDERLKAVSDHVRTWLFPAQPAPPAHEATPAAPGSVQTVDIPEPPGDDDE